MLDVESLNAECACVTLDRQALCRALEAEVGDAQFCKSLAVSHPTLISTLPVFVSPAHVREMAATIAAIERVAASPAYREAALADTPAICHRNHGPLGVLMGYDFHLGEDGPRLIEINTNAGGALINAFIAGAQKACCGELDELLEGRAPASRIERAPFVRMFEREFERQRGPGARPRRIAIVDDEPEQQYLYPEFVLFRQLFRHHGIEAEIAAPRQLDYRAGRLLVEERHVDLVYNRLTDFSLSSPEHASLRAAYLDGAAVVTPHPHAHALLADKRNLVRLSDARLLQVWGVDSPTVEILQRAVPRTILVTQERAQDLWSNRARLFFKPAGGFGGKAAYRGDKITRRVWESIVAGGYVAQEIVSPSSRTVVIDGERKSLKVDVRNYTYAAEVLLVAARLYQGQTTNFRTPGGGFAPVLSGAYAA